jgi:hypothetical protein
MIADGIDIDIFSLLKIKLFLVKAIGFTDTSMVPSPSGNAFHVRFAAVDNIPDLAIPIVNALSGVLDAQHPYDLPSSAMGGIYADDDNPWRLLVGTIFVDVLLATFCSVENLLSLPDSTVKGMLESLMIIIYKHDLDSRPLKQYQNYLRRAIRCTLDLLLEATSYELRRLALSVVQACTKRWTTLMGNIL